MENLIYNYLFPVIIVSFCIYQLQKYLKTPKEFNDYLFLILIFGLEFKISANYLGLLTMVVIQLFIIPTSLFMFVGRDILKIMKKDYSMAIEAIIILLFALMIFFFPDNNLTERLILSLMYVAGYWKFIRVK